MSLLDAISTFLLVDDDSYLELNPLMSALLEGSYLQFFGVKLGMTMLGTLVCWHYYERSANDRLGLKIISRTYCALMIWQALLLTDHLR